MNSKSPSDSVSKSSPRGASRTSSKASGRGKFKNTDTIVAMLLVGLFGLIWALVNKDHMSSRSRDFQMDASSEKPIDLVNQHLREVYDKIEQQEADIKHLNALTAPPIPKIPDVQDETNFDEIPWAFDDLSPSTWEGQNLNSLAQEALAKRPLNQQVQKEVIDDLRKAESLQQYKEALSAAIVAQAKQKGYEIQVDKDYRVRSVRKIIKTEHPSIFDTKSYINDISK